MFDNEEIWAYLLAYPRSNPTAPSLVKEVVRGPWLNSENLRA